MIHHHAHSSTFFSIVLHCLSVAAHTSPFHPCIYFTSRHSYYTLRVSSNPNTSNFSSQHRINGSHIFTKAFNLFTTALSNSSSSSSTAIPPNLAMKTRLSGICANDAGKTFLNAHP
mmetsp:Transcript_7025/g.13085  ORF Transcript_7025/g.13085 Transcript_7025/m.13085 type:complete len:116 (+) Transcript_7025:59-406(+)